jgi:D-3-phosphoglycerate dehydrogenase
MTPSEKRIILITDPLAQEGLDVLSGAPEFEIRIRPGLTPQELETEIAGAEALLVRSGTRVTAELIAAAPALAVIGRAGTGVDNIDVAAATRRGVVVMNTPGGNATAACEHTFALLLALFRRLPDAVADLREGGWNRTRFVGRQLSGRTLGVIGFGRIGREVAARARAFGMPVLVHDPWVGDALAREWEARCVDLDRLLVESDVVTLHLPLSDETRHLIDAGALSRMKRDAVIVNCARGGLIDETALAAALDEGRLHGAALDVFETEPAGRNPLVRHPRVVATPHLGASTEEAQLNLAVELARQVRDLLLRGEVRHAVNMPSLSAEARALVRPYLDLGERLGALVAQVLGGGRSVTVTFRGECMELPRGPVVSAVMVGLLGAGRGGSAVNYVNARLAAAESGLAVEERAMKSAGDHEGLIEVELAGADGMVTVAGGVTAAGNLRLARWDGLALDAPPSGPILLLRNPDVPGVVGVVGTLLGEAGLNIAHIAWGRDEAAGQALTLINLDQPVPDDLFEHIRRHPKVLWAARVHLP